LTLDQPYALLSLFVFSLIFLLPLLPGQNGARRIEQSVVHFTQRRTAAIFTLFLAVIVFRLLLLPRFGIPLPYIHDEFGYLLLGDTFAHGRLVNPAHPMWMSFETFHVMWTPKYFAIYPPAQGLALAVGELLGRPWIGILLGVAAMCAAILWMLQAWLPARWAFLGAVLVAVKFGLSHYWINSYWGGAMAATGGALVLGGVCRILRKAKLFDTVMLGLGVAILANSRPYEGLLFCLPSCGVLLWWLAGKAKTTLDPLSRFKKVFLPLAIMLVITVAFTAYYNYRLTGNPLLFPHVLSMRTYHSESPLIWGHLNPPLHYNNAPFERFFNEMLRKEYTPGWSNAWGVLELKANLFAQAYLWPGTLLLLPFVPLALLSRKLRLLVVTLAVVIAGSLVLVWSNPHYLAPVTGIVFALIIQAMRRLQILKLRGRRIGAALARAVVVLLLVETVSNIERGIANPMQPWSRADMNREAIRQSLQSMPGKHLVIVRYATSHNVFDEWVYNGADIDGAKVLWARELGAEQNLKLVDYFKDRTVWIVEPDNSKVELLPYQKPSPDAAPKTEAVP
jgi:hypothetical protein